MSAETASLPFLVFFCRRAIEWRNVLFISTLTLGISAMDGSRGNQGPPVWEGEDLSDLTKRLLLYAHYLLRRHTSWRGNAAGAAPGAVSPQDLVQIAFEKYNRRTRPDHVSPYMLLKGIIRGEVGHLAERTENRHDHVFISSSDGPGVITPEAIPDHNQRTPEEELIANDTANELLCRVRRHFYRDKDLLAYVDLLATEEFATTYEFSEALGVSREEIFNFNRRLARFRRGELQS
jgi:hypothetical protein